MKEHISAAVGPLGWHVISGELLLEYLRRAVTEDPDLLFAELWANAAHDDVSEGETP